MYHNLVLASECIRDVGSNRILGTLENDVNKELRKALDIPQRSLNVFERVVLRKEKPDWMERRAQAIETLARAGAGYWYAPYGEPEWVDIPAGEFWMGEPNEAQKVHADGFQIARVPITNAQYALFVEAAEYKVPSHFEDERVPKGLESHPVVNVNWQDALAYCQWLSEVTGKNVGLPSEVEWEKAARGAQDKREYPWGDHFEMTRANTSELGLDTTTPVGIFQEGASPYGVLDLSGNVWEWTDSRYDKEQTTRVLRGGSWYYFSGALVVPSATGSIPVGRFNLIGFRVVVSRAFR